MSSVSHRGLTYLGMDLHKDSISVGILAPEDDVAEVERIFHDEASVRRLVGRFGARGSCHAPAGLTFYDHARRIWKEAWWAART